MAAGHPDIYLYYHPAFKVIRKDKQRPAPCSPMAGLTQPNVVALDLRPGAPAGTSALTKCWRAVPETSHTLYF